ncbi:MAG: alpha/beta hydrolase [Acidobacteria bacterium]|nr:alpha/beta hydrolase [Acidobacteriota bacterium]
MNNANLSRPCPAYQLHNANSALPLLVYVAGMDGTGELFYQQIPTLMEQFRVVTFRLRDDPMATYADLTSDLAAIIQDLDAAPALIVGESFGGSIALTFALHYPALVGRLVLVNSFPYYRRRIRINLAATLAALVPFPMVLPFRLAMASLGLYVDGVTGDDRRRILQVLRTVEMKSYARRLRLIAEVNLEDRLAEITAPTLLIASTRDLLVRSVREAQFMASRMPNATVKIIRGAGHACLLGERVRLRQLLHQWLTA